MSCEAEHKDGADAPMPADDPAPVRPPVWRGDGVGARALRFALTVMAPVVVGLSIGVDLWLVYAMVTCILAFTLDTGGTPRQRLWKIAGAGLVVLAGSGLGTLAADTPAAIILGFAGVGMVYALFESIDDAAAAASRFLCLTFAVGALYAPLTAFDAGVVAGFALYAFLVSLAFDALAGAQRLSTTPAPREIYARLRATERQRLFFAAAVAITIPLAYLTSAGLGVRHPYWALIAVVIVLRGDQMSSRAQIGHMLFGTALGITAALLCGLATSALHAAWPALPPRSLLLIAMTVAALLRWPLQGLSGTLGTAALTAFILLFLETITGSVAGTAAAMGERLADAMIGCSFAVLALVLETLMRRAAARLFPPER